MKIHIFGRGRGGAEAVPRGSPPCHRVQRGTASVHVEEARAVLGLLLRARRAGVRLGLRRRVLGSEGRHGLPIAHGGTLRELLDDHGALVEVAPLDAGGLRRGEETLLGERASGAFCVSREHDAPYIRTRRSTTGKTLAEVGSVPAKTRADRKHLRDG